MAIYDIFEFDRKEVEKEACCSEGEPEFSHAEELLQKQISQGKTSWRDRFFSSLTVRLFFLLLLIADLLWFCYAASLFLLSCVLNLVTASKFSRLNSLKERMWLSIKRSLVCGFSLFITLFSPAFGIMIACTYFLMYDKSGIEEVVPASLQAQFKEFFRE